MLYTRPLFFLVFFWFFFSGNCISQTTPIDSVFIQNALGFIDTKASLKTQLLNEIKNIILEDGKLKSIQKITKSEKRLDAKTKHDIYYQLHQIFERHGKDNIALRCAAFTALMKSRQSGCTSSFHAEQYLQKVIDRYENKELVEENESLGVVYEYLAIIQEKRGKYTNAKSSYEQALDIYEKINSKRIAKIRKPLGNIKMRFGEYEEGKVLLEKALNTLLKQSPNSKSVAGLYQDISILYYIQTDFETAIKKCDEGLARWGYTKEKTPLDDYDVLLNIAKAKYLYEFNKIEESQLLVEQIFDKIDTSLIRSKYLAHAYSIRGEIQIDYDISAARRSLEQAYNTKNTLYGCNPLKREVSKLEITLGDLEENSGNITKALEYYQKALKNVLPDFEYKSLYDNPNAKDFYTENIIAEAITRKAELFFKIYENNPSAEQLELVVATFQLAIQAQDIIMEQLQYESSKLHLSDENHARFGNTIAALYEQQEKYDVDNTGTILQLMEKAKAVVLKNALTDKRAEAVLQDKTMINTLRTLRQKENEAVQQLYIAKATAKENAIQAAELVLDNVRSNIITTLKTLENLNEKYYRLRHENKALTIKDIQDEILQNQQLLIEYYYGIDRTYAVAVPKSGVAKAFKIEVNSESDTQIENFINTLAQGPGLNNYARFQQFSENAHQLYDLLLDPILEQFPNSTSLNIIPDGRLNILPFEVLLAENSNMTEADFEENFEIVYAKLDYLIKEKTIHYNYLAAINLLELSLAVNELPYLGIAPDYRACEPLQNGVTCVNDMKTLLGGKVLTGPSATKTRCLEELPNANIIHFYGHAKANYNDPEGAFMQFSCSENYYAYEIYGQRFNTDLLVFSACETGDGYFKSGEGIFSLARAFRYAGVRNLVMSIWKGNDRYVPAMAKFFFEEVKLGVSYEQALQQAKLNYLKQSENSDSLNPHPYYWAYLHLIS